MGLRRIAFIADGHLDNFKQLGGAMSDGLNRRGRQAIATLRAARELCEQEGREVATLVSLGDLFNTTKPPPQLIAACQDALNEMPTIALLGNHEMVSTGQGDNSLGPLRPVAEVIEQPTVRHEPGFDLWLVPYRPGPAAKWLAEDIAELAVGLPKTSKRPRILCLHLGISDENTPYHLDGCEDSVSVLLLEKLCASFGISHVMAGNWHRRKLWYLPHTTVMQVGALCPTGFNNPGVKGYGSVVLIDEAGQTLVHELPGPRFVKCKSLDELLRCRAVMPEGTELYAHLTVPAADYHEAVADLQAMRDAKELIDGKVDVLEDDVQEATEEAVKRVREACGDEAVLLYIDNMNLPDDVDRSALKQKCVEYLKPE